jgi:superfamily I DNA/RNA helicase
VKWNQYQEAAFDVTENENCSVALEALAGTGKTTTIVEASNRVDPNKITTFVAFNKAIATELQARLSSNIRASTLHSMGLKNLSYNDRSIKVDNFKCRNIYRQMNTGSADIESQVMRLVSLGKTTDQMQPDFEDLMNRFEIVIEYNDIEYALDLANQVFKRSSMQRNIVDFDDMIWLPAMGFCSMYKSDNLFVDERQDLNPAQIAMLKRAVKPSGRVIAVGDEHQAIYGFRGAAINSMEQMIADFRMKVMPLPICYRCGTKIIELAQTIVPEIQAAPGAIEGEVIYSSIGRKLFSALKDDDLVLCRTNAPLVSLCLQCIANGVKAQIRGRDIGKSLETLIAKVQRKYIADSLPQFLTALLDYSQNEIAKLLAADKIGPASTLSDQVETIIALSESANSIDDIHSRIAAIFSDDIRGVTLSSVHRAKGTEADCVYIIRPDLIPHPMAKTTWQREQEMNLKYVAITRAKKQLTFVTGG